LSRQKGHDEAGKRLRVWTLTDGSAGSKNQVVGLVEALGWKALHKVADLRGLWSLVPGGECLWSPLKHLRPAGVLGPPWPQILVSAGRRAALIARSVRRVSQGKTQLIHLQNPGKHPQDFRWIIVPEHDGLEGYNVIHTRGALHHVTPSKLQRAKLTCKFLDSLPSPRIAVLLGGSLRHKYTLMSRRMALLIQELQHMKRETGASLMISTSRRTGDTNAKMLREAFTTEPGVIIWDGSAPNPYLGYLAWADTVLVTEDSINMMSEAMETEKPIYTLPLPGLPNVKSKRFAQRLVDEGIARLYQGGKLATWSYTPYRDLDHVLKQLQADDGLV
jgi:mitochondrial fission protein ELM1